MFLTTLICCVIITQHIRNSYTTWLCKNSNNCTQHIGVFCTWEHTHNFYCSQQYISQYMTSHYTTYGFFLRISVVICYYSLVLPHLYNTVFGCQSVWLWIRHQQSTQSPHVTPALSQCVFFFLKVEQFIQTGFCVFLQTVFDWNWVRLHQTQPIFFRGVPTTIIKPQSTRGYGHLSGPGLSLPVDSSCEGRVSLHFTQPGLSMPAAAGVVSEYILAHIGPREHVGRAPPGGVWVWVWSSSWLYYPFGKGLGQHITQCLKKKSVRTHERTN